MASNGTQRRVLVKDLEGRVNELESKLSDLIEQLQKLDQRMQMIADSLTATRALQA